MLRLLVTAILFAVLIFSVLIAYGYLSFSGSIDADIGRLTRAARSPDGRVTSEQLAALPPTAQRYFTHARVAAGTAIPRLVRLKQKGRIRSSTDAGWMTFEATEIYSTNPPALIWRAWFPTPVMPVVLGRDEYLDGQGSIVMKMLALMPVADERGEELAAAGLMRYLNEMMWFPAAMLGGNVAIGAVDDTSFSLAIEDRGMRAEAVIEVDADGRPLNFAALRYNTGTRSMERWETPLSAEATFGDHVLPSTGSAVWKLAAGDLSYIELDITEVAYED